MIALNFTFLSTKAGSALGGSIWPKLFHITVEPVISTGLELSGQKTKIDWSKLSSKGCSQDDSSMGNTSQINPWNHLLHDIFQYGAAKVGPKIITWNVRSMCQQDSRLCKKKLKNIFYLHIKQTFFACKK